MSDDKYQHIEKEFEERAKTKVQKLKIKDRLSNDFKRAKARIDASGKKTLDGIIKKELLYGDTHGILKGKRKWNLKDPELIFDLPIRISEDCIPNSHRDVREFIDHEMEMTYLPKLYQVTPVTPEIETQVQKVVSQVCQINEILEKVHQDMVVLGQMFSEQSKKNMDDVVQACDL